MHEKDNQHWAHLCEAGTLYGLYFLLGVQKIFGRRVFSLMLHPVSLYFLLFRGSARRASLDYLRKHYEFQPEAWKQRPGYGMVYRHFMAFGEVVLDKLLAWSKEMTEAEFVPEDEEALTDLQTDTRGQLIIGSHLGNLEYCRGFMQRYKSRTINVLLYDQHAANFVRVMQKIDPQSRMNVYQVNELDIPRILQLKQKIDSGEWLFIAGDRVPLSGNERTADVEFLGHQAPFPEGPYILARTLACPVKFMFSYREGEHICFSVKAFAESIKLPTKNREEFLQAQAQAFAQELERHCIKAPLQWFNFYEFWGKKTPTNTERELARE